MPKSNAHGLSPGPIVASHQCTIQACEGLTGQVKPCEKGPNFLQMTALMTTNPGPLFIAKPFTKDYDQTVSVWARSMLQILNKV